MVLGIAFLPGPFGFLAWFALIPLLDALQSRIDSGAPGLSLFRLGMIFGGAFFLIGMHWIALLSDVAITVPWLKYPAWIAAAFYLALYSGLAVWLAGTLTRRARVPLAIVLPFVFLAVEELRASGEMGFPWFQPGYTQHAYAQVLQLASLGSVTLVTLWLSGVNVLLWRAWRGGSRVRSLAGALLLLVLPWLWGQRVLDAASDDPGPSVALIQGNIPGAMKWSGKHQREILDTYLGLSSQAASDSLRPVIAIWPETATGTFLRRQLDQAIEVTEFAGRSGLPVFSGFPDYELGADGAPRYLNAAGILAPGTEGHAIYGKRHLVPFGERMPFQWLIPALGKIELGQAEWTPGVKAVLFESGAGRFSTLICFESIFSDLAREDVRAGARWLVNITNDEWFGNSAALYQHAAMANFRAVENHVPLARCANTGLTALIDANGRVTRALPVFQPGVLVGRLGVPGVPTLFGRFGDWPGLLAGVIVMVFVVLALRRRPAHR